MRCFVKSGWLLVLLFGCMVGNAFAEPAKDADIEHLLEVTRVRSTLEQMIPQIEAMQQQAIQQAIGGRELDSAEQEALSAAKAATRRFLRDELSWEQMRPLYVQIYRDTFDRQDIQALIEFYETPVGQRLLDRQPLLMQNVMRAMQEKMLPALENFEREVGQVLQKSASREEK